jgi:DeoR family transcriptional regulator, fructose operon transcriptional repressor
MLAEERRLLIVDWTREEGRLDAAEAAAKLNVATETVRRDLDVLQRRGIVRRVHGGAIAMERFAHEYTIPERKNLNPDAKKRIAETAGQYVPDEGCIFVDGGTTTEFLAPALRNRPDLLVVTNSVNLASRIADSSTKTYMLSGRIRPTTLSSVGARTVEDLSQLNAVVAFVGVNGISPTLQLTAFDTDEALVKQVMITNSAERILLADHSKFGSTYPVTFGKPEDFDRLVTDLGTDSRVIEKFTDRGVEVVVA